MSDDLSQRLVRLEEQHKSLNDKVAENRARIAQQDSNIRFVVIAVISSIIGAIMKMVTGGGL